MFFMFLLAPLSVSAQSQLGCLEKAAGKTLEWNARWGEDRQDDRVEYEVVNVTVKHKLPDRSVTLELKARQRAIVSQRTARADSEESARRYCEKLYEKRTFVDPFEQKKVDHDFIHYTKDGWVRDYQPEGKRLVDCPIGPVVFSCTEEDKLRYGGSLKSVEEQIRWLEQ